MTSFKLVFTIILGCFLSASIYVRADDHSNAIEDQKRLLTDGIWFCDESDEEVTVTAIEWYSPNGSSVAYLSVISSMFDVDFITHGSWSIPEENKITEKIDTWVAMNWAFAEGLTNEDKEEFKDEFEQIMGAELVRLNEEATEIEELSEDVFAIVDDGEPISCKKTSRYFVRKNYDINFTY